MAPVALQPVAVGRRSAEAEASVDVARHGWPRGWPYRNATRVARQPAIGRLTMCGRPLGASGMVAARPPLPAGPGAILELAISTPSTRLRNHGIALVFASPAVVAEA